MTLEERLGDWYPFLKGEFDKQYMKDIAVTLRKERNNYEIYPSSEDVFRAYRTSSFHKTKVVILGQDPYHTPGMADGLAFSTPDEMAKPPSLLNILEEVENNFKQMNLSFSNDLSSWAEQGVLLLNTILTVRKGQAKSHVFMPWDLFIEKTLEVINKSPQPIVFLLWGNDAKRHMKLVDREHHHVLTAPHPSPLSAYRGFFGCEHFKKCNQFLENNNLEPINWFSNKIN